MTNLKPNRGAKLNLGTRTQDQKAFKVPPRPAELPAAMGKEWAQVCRNLHREGLWHDDRAAIVSAYLYNIYIYRQAAAVLAEFGLFDDDGKPHSAQLAAQRAQNAAQVAAKNLGLTVSQTVLSRQGTPDASPKTAAAGGAWAKAGGKK